MTIQPFYGADFGDVPNAATGVWHQLVVRRSNLLTSFFFDGASVGSNGNRTIILPDSLAPLQLGLADGRLDELAMWNRALSDREITKLYNGGAGQALVMEAQAVNPAEGTTVSTAPTDFDVAFS